jgi:hypothetical protein
VRIDLDGCGSRGLDKRTCRGRRLLPSERRIRSLGGERSVLVILLRFPNILPMPLHWSQETGFREIRKSHLTVDTKCSTTVLRWDK